MNTFFNYNIVWIDLHNLPLHAKFYDFDEDEAPKFSTCDIDKVKEGVSFKVAGHMLPNCERFSISLVIDNETRDIALYINPRLPQNYVVRNTRLNNRWGKDEDASAIPFNLTRGTDFVIQILVTKRRFMISLNGRHFAKYTHRVSYKTITCIEVHGDVRNIRVDQSKVTNYPEGLPELQDKYIQEVSSELTVNHIKPVFSRFRLCRHMDIILALPFYGILPPNSFGLDQHLRIEGRVKLLPWSFYINLQGGQNTWPHPIVALHLRCRFAKYRDIVGKNVVTRTAYYNHMWEEEEVSELTTNLRPSKVFSMIIVRGVKSYEVYVNKIFITEFRFRVNPNIVDTVFVLGDIHLWDVVLEHHDPTDFIKPRLSIDFADILDDLI